MQGRHPTTSEAQKKYTDTEQLHRHQKHLPFKKESRPKAGFTNARQAPNDKRGPEEYTDAELSHGF